MGPRSLEEKVTSEKLDENIIEEYIRILRNNAYRTKENIA